MVGKSEFTLDDVLSKKEVEGAVRAAAGARGEARVVGHELKRAAEGIIGFLGDHIRVTLHVAVGAETRSVQLFVKRMPCDNRDKASFIDEGNYFRREQLSFQLFESLGGDTGPNPWRPKAYIYTDSLLVMPDLTVDGYRSQPYYETLDISHLKLCAATIARFHAAYANYATKKPTNGKKCYSFLDENADIMEDPTFCDSPWVAVAAKVSDAIINNFSTNYRNFIPKFEERLAKLYVEACLSLKEYEDTINVLLHKDLWANNIMFRYENDKPTNAILVDFQCVRYGPPAFDLAVLLYLVASRKTREDHEKDVLSHYYNIFEESLDEATKLRLNTLGYNKAEFSKWYEIARKLGMFTAIGIYPYVLMDPMTAKKTFDDPDTYQKFCFNERQIPVIEYAKDNEIYRNRQVEVTEEFIERYVLGKCI